MLDRLDDTIVAISSAPGYGGVGIVRLSGPDAFTIADRMATTEAGEPLASYPGSTRVSGNVLIDEEIGFPATFYLFRAPHSYTRQDIVEIHTVGSPPALALVRKRAVALGAVLAEPGEFTARAFLSGAMDLATAEAVAGVIRAQTDTQLRASRRMMDGALTRQIKDVRDQLAELLGLVEADIDFAEEPIEFITPGVLRERLGGIKDGLSPLLSGAVVVERFDVLPHILLLGPPNAGKSTLMNRLSGTDRAICAAAAGTTRDVLSAPMRLRRGEAILLDAAGVDEWDGLRRASGPSPTTDVYREWGTESTAPPSAEQCHPGATRAEQEIVAAARAMALSTAERVDLVCLVVDLTTPDDETVFETVRSLDVGGVVIAANKCDLVPGECSEERLERLRSHKLGPVCRTSALTGTGVDMLRDMLTDALGSAGTTTMGESVLVSERQRTAIREASDTIQRAISLSQGAAETIDCADLLAFELREALDALGTVTGEVTTEDLLGQVFANFCIGK